MTTKILQIYEAITALCEANLTDYTRLPNAYSIDANTMLNLKQGFAVGIGPGNDTEKYATGLMSWERLYNITLVRQVLTTQNNTTVRETIEKSIVDDLETLRIAIRNSANLNGLIATKSTIRADGGMNFIDGNTQKFLGLEIQLIVDYEFDPNT